MRTSIMMLVAAALLLGCGEVTLGSSVPKPEGVVDPVDLKGLAPGMKRAAIEKALPAAKCVPSAEVLAQMNDIASFFGAMAAGEKRAGPLGVDETARKLTRFADSGELDAARHIYASAVDTVCRIGDGASFTYANRTAHVEIGMKANKALSVILDVLDSKPHDMTEALATRFKWLNADASALEQQGALLLIAMALGLGEGIPDTAGNTLFVVESPLIPNATRIALLSPEYVAAARSVVNDQHEAKVGAKDM